jgi:uncharacterized membrane protein
MRNLPEIPIIFLVYSPKSYFLVFGVILIAISEINYIKHCHWPELRPKTRVSGLILKLTNAMRVVTQDFCRKPKLKFLVVTQVVRMSSRS